MAKVPGRLIVILLALAFARPLGAAESRKTWPLSPATRHDLRQAIDALNEAKASLKSGSPQQIVPPLESAKTLLRKDDYHALSARVMQAKHEVDLAEMSAEEERMDDANDHIANAVRFIREDLSNRREQTTSQMREPQNPRAETARQPYWKDLHGVPEEAETRAALEEKKQEQAGETPKPEHTCGECTATTGAGEWMEGAAESGSSK